MTQGGGVLQFVKSTDPNGFLAPINSDGAYRRIPVADMQRMMTAHAILIGALKQSSNLQTTVDTISPTNVASKP